MDEKKLIELARKGNSEAFNKLLGNYQSRLFAVCMRYIKNYDDAQDCLVNCMLRIYKAFPSFKGESSLYTWMYRVATTACLDELRRKKRSRDTSLNALLELGWAPTESPDAGPEKQALQHERKKLLAALLDELPEDTRNVIILRDIEGFSYEEIATITNTNLGTVKSKISRTRLKLRKTIEEKRELFESLLV